MRATAVLLLAILGLASCEKLETLTPAKDVPDELHVYTNASLASVRLGITLNGKTVGDSTGQTLTRFIIPEGQNIMVKAEYGDSVAVTVFKGDKIIEYGYINKILVL